MRKAGIDSGGDDLKVAVKPSTEAKQSRNERMKGIEPGEKMYVETFWGSAITQRVAYRRKT